MNDKGINKPIRDKKCRCCYKGEWCWLLEPQRTGCIGPFKGHEDSMKKIRKHFKEEEITEEDRGRFRRQAMIDRYREYMKILEDD